MLNTQRGIKEVLVHNTFQRRKKVNQFSSILAKGIFPRLLNPSMCQAAKITLKCVSSAVILEIIQEAKPSPKFFLHFKQEML